MFPAAMSAKHTTDWESCQTSDQPHHNPENEANRLRVRRQRQEHGNAHPNSQTDVFGRVTDICDRSPRGHVCKRCLVRVQDSTTTVFPALRALTSLSFLMRGRPRASASSTSYLAMVAAGEEEARGKYGAGICREVVSMGVTRLTPRGRR